ncbi:MAG TPA: peptidoglycan bridge formation glycyltransferase FemA/FemB family protein [Anaerolineaceae bacterium]|jgi:lipid II:glycine glycyltransferase (peptidoglycan interpeptide bridge formation enzyme)|nr:peptidoglycan bridge formation glycyltransferase FemA/FemB family protein [Anaerolineaceae bacterium]
MTLPEASQWDQFTAARPDIHLLQTSAWAALKQPFGWDAAWVCQGDTGAQILFRRLPLGLRVAYLPKGPVGPDWAGLWPAVDRLCRSRGAIFLKVEPDAWEDAVDTLQPRLPGFTPAEPIQPRRTIVLDLSGPEADWLERMKPKTRYNIRLAERKEVTVDREADLAAFQELMTITGQRDGFGVHAPAYYRRAYELFQPGGHCALLTARYQGAPLAALMVFAQGSRAWYFYGASSDAERSRMPTYLLQWEAMRWAAAQGCTSYDLWGVPDAAEDVLETDFTQRADGLWGVYRFKRGFGGQLLRSAGAWDRVYHPALYRLYGLYRRRTGREV